MGEGGRGERNSQTPHAHPTNCLQSSKQPQPSAQPPALPPPCPAAAAAAQGGTETERGAAPSRLGLSTTRSARSEACKPRGVSIVHHEGELGPGHRHWLRRVVHAEYPRKRRGRLRQTHGGGEEGGLSCPCPVPVPVPVAVTASLHGRWRLHLWRAHLPGARGCRCCRGSRRWSQCTRSEGSKHFSLSMSLRLSMSLSMSLSLSRACARTSSITTTHRRLVCLGVEAWRDGHIAGEGQGGDTAGVFVSANGSSSDCTAALLPAGPSLPHRCPASVSASCGCRHLR